MLKYDAKVLIINSATKYFSKFGFHKTTMDEIARHIHKAKGILYYYFKSKEELFNEVLKQELNTVKIELMKIVETNSDSLFTLKEYTLTRLRLLHKAVNYHETLKADFFEKYLFVKDVREDFAAFERDQLTKILERGKNEGFLDFTNINSTINIFMMVINGIEIPLYLQEKYSEYESTIDELSSMIVNSLRTQKK
ncbi:MAG TPA: helix-turn-helix domain-containing protein [Bacteroidales bacterium]|nr:helix-turn-helix domain-containing protein [Bacteroidales bacterium]